ncbi:hypothetical protein JOE63_002209 [Cellulosimicrobium cellulans]|uniref:DUF3159 domain-containing protein n=1 Tax=Cellulosimicrobium cellulans TaxID=1710 RepID=A0A1Y0I0A1_CELCE|nr:DUF3159 domain-containing protein [Cellulosimicrobium cellulans]ARU52965.1 hypothetical protein CBR64_17490 [Cellulosimicrobium cellulans]MBM7819732.1 hypothetical protein [Cellulosimicrobium cellulans]
MTSSSDASGGPVDGRPGHAPEGLAHDAEVAETVVDDVAAPEDGRARGVRALAGQDFSVADAIGGVRGLVESVAPGLVFVVVYVATTNLQWALVTSVAAALVAVAARLIQRTPVTQAFGGLLGVGIGVIWAWRSGEAQDYFAWGLWTNAAYLVALLVSVLARWPLVGLVVEGFRSGFGAGAASGSAGTTADPYPDAVDAADASAEQPAAAATPGDADAAAPGAFARWARTWRSDRTLMRRYTAATWLWIGLFAARLAVQVPLYLDGDVGWLGTARLVMGIPLWALVLWLTWILVRRPHGAAAPQPTA